jgi:hypothetical protein
MRIVTKWCDKLSKLFDGKNNKNDLAIDVPDLISFKVGDLLRCKFSSK